MIFMKNFILFSVVICFVFSSCEKEETTPNTNTTPQTPTYTKMGIDQVGGIYKPGQDLQINIPNVPETVFDSKYSIELKYLGNQKVKMVINSQTNLPSSLKSKDYFIHKSYENSSASSYFLSDVSPDSTAYTYGKINISLTKYGVSILAGISISDYKIEGYTLNLQSAVR